MGELLEIMYRDGAGGGISPDPRVSGIEPIDAWLNCPVDPRRILNQEELGKLLAGMRAQTAAVPIKTLQQAVRHNQIEAHNAEIDRQRQERKNLREVAKKTGMPVEEIKRMVKSVRRT